MCVERQVQAPRYPFFLPCLAALTPGQLLQRSLRSTSSHSLDSHTCALPSLFLHIPSVFPRLPHGTPHSLTMAAPPPKSLPCSPRSSPRSNSSLAFVPSSQVCMYVCMSVCMYVRMYVCMYVYIYIDRHIYDQTSISWKLADDCQKIVQQKSESIVPEAPFSWT